MKTVLPLVVGLVIAGPLGFAGEEFSNVSFVVEGPKHFTDGDRIVIEQVQATSTNLTVGDKVVVRGRYDLRSENNAHVCLFVTSIEGAGVPVIPSQCTEIKKGSGQFELSEIVRVPGQLHVSFYRISDRKRFGSVYFGTESQMKDFSYKNALD